MTAQHLPQLSAAIVSATAPWLVVEVVRHAAARFAREAGGTMPMIAGVRRLRGATLAVLPPLAAFALWMPPQSGWVGLVDLAVFAILSVPGLVVLGKIEGASRPFREVRADVRVASLTPRRVSQYLPWSRRLLPYVIVSIGLLLLAWRLTFTVATRELFVPLGFALAAGAFLLLYEVWTTGLVTGPVVSDDAGEVQRRIRFARVVQAIEVGLVTIMIAMTHILLDVDWTSRGGLAASLSLAGAVVAIAGCALALSSDLMRRQYVDNPGRASPS
jgi:hypothetical protein